MPFKVNRLNFLLFVLYKIILDYTYVYIQSDLFAYSGYDKVISQDRIVVGWFIFLIMTFLVCRWKGGLYSLFFYVMQLVTFVPFIVFYQYYADCKLWMVLAQCIGLVFMMVVFKIPQGVNRKQIGKIDSNRIEFSNKSFQVLLIISLLVYFLASLVKFGIPTLESMLFANVYETRAEANLPLMFVLFQNLFCKILLPFCILWYAKNNHWALMSLCLAVQIYTYAITGLKTYLFIPFVLLAILFVKKLNLERVILCGMIVVVLLVDFLYFDGQDTIWYALVGNRIIFFAARIKFSYFDYFSTHDFAYFSQSSLAHIFGFKSNYSVNIPNMIGENYFDKPGMWTNTGFMADAYSNLGFVGIILMALILAIVLRWAKRTIKDIPSPYNIMVEAIFLIFFITLNDGAVISVLFSGGMIAAIIVFRFLNFNDKVKTTIPRSLEAKCGESS